MGTLIVMTRPTGLSRREMPIGASADILFFTGVRYSRMPDQGSVEEAAHLSPIAIVAPVRRRSEKAKKAAEARRIKRRA